MIWGLGFVFVFGFVLGMLAIVAVEAAGLMYIVRRLNRKKERAESKENSVQSTGDLDPHQSLDFALNKQGIIWILELDEGLKNSLMDKLQDPKRRRGFVEVYPVRRYGRIKDHKLIISDADGSQTAVQLKGCTIEAVSATGLPSRKWAKRYPIKVESKTSVIYNEIRGLYIYLETSWEKESWCKALGLASCEDQDRLIWLTKLNEEFRSYLTSLNAKYPSFMKPSGGFAYDIFEKGNKIDVSSSKVRMFWKKFSRKHSNKGVSINPSTREDRKISEKVRSFQDSQYGSSSVNSIPQKKMPDNISEENSVQAFSRTASHSSHVSVASDVESEDKFYADEGTLSWNLLVSRLFFDANLNTQMKTSIQARIQRMLSNMRTPSYIGEVICTNIETGKLPPYIHGIRVLPMEMNEVWAFELDIEYCGGAVLDVETRLEVREIDLQKGIVDTSLQPSSEGDVSSDLLEGFEYFGKQLNIPVENIDTQGPKDEGDAKLDGSKGSTGNTTVSNSLSKWKSILKNIAQQVSQVPFSLSIRVVSLRGTLRLHIKPPPSDQLWFSFTSMPEIEFDLASSIGDHKINSGHVAMFLTNRFKTAICETMVLPNCESICIPWMLAKKDDWVPRRVAPFMWLNQAAGGDHDSFRASGAKSKSEVNKETLSHHSDTHKLRTKLKTASLPMSSSPVISMHNSKSMQDLKTPLLGSNEKQDACEQETRQIPGTPSPSRSLSASEDDKPETKKISRRARMLDLGKKMGEKLEEKRRHIEEKGRHMVEKMRGS